MLKTNSSGAARIREGWAAVRVYGVTPVLRRIGWGVRAVLAPPAAPAAEPVEAPEPAPAVAVAAEAPLLTIATPVFDVAPEVWAATARSVLAQTYGRWEWCLADGASTRPGLGAAMRALARDEPRVRLQRLERNLGISGNANEAWRRGRGAHVLFLDHDDLLEPDALARAAQALARAPETDVLYFDEDKVDPDGRRIGLPFRKPDWSPHLLWSVNYLTHAVYARARLEEAGGFDPRFDGAQDWDLALRCAPRVRRAVHLARVLYHWRSGPASAASGAGAKPWAAIAQLRALEAALRARGLADAAAEFWTPSLPRLTWRAPGRAAVLVPVAAGADPAVVHRHVAQIRRRTRAPGCEVHVVPLHAGEAAEAGLDRAARACGADFLTVLPAGWRIPDPDWLEELRRWAALEEVAAAGPKLLDADRRLLAPAPGGSGPLARGGGEHELSAGGSPDWYRDAPVLPLPGLTVRRAVWRELGGFAGEAGGAWGRRGVAAGRWNVCTPFARLLRAGARLQAFIGRERMAQF